MLLVTNMTLVALLEHYRHQVLQPHWKVQQETMDERLAASSWTLRDEADQLWFGVLLITPSEERMWVRLWPAGGGGVQTFVFPEGRERPVPGGINELTKLACKMSARGGFGIKVERHGS